MYRVPLLLGVTERRRAGGTCAETLRRPRRLLRQLWKVVPAPCSASFDSVGAGERVTETYAPPAAGVWPVMGDMHGAQEVGVWGGGGGGGGC